MSVELTRLIARTEAALAAATDPKRRLRLERDLASFKLTAIRAEGGGEEDDEEEDDEEDDKSGKAAKRAEESKRRAEAAKHKAKADEHRARAAEADEEAKRCLGAEDDEEEEETKSLRASLSIRATSGAVAATESLAVSHAEQNARIAALEKSARERETRAMIAEAQGARRITPGEAKTLASKSDAFVRDFLTMRPKAIVNTEESAMVQPASVENADIPASAVAQVDALCASLPASLTADQRAKIRQDMINSRRALGAGVNGVGGRY
jgi:hypothetical protein